MSDTPKPTRAEYLAAVAECVEAGCLPDTPWWELSERAKQEWVRQMEIILAYAGTPTFAEEALRLVMQRGIAFAE